MVLVNTVNEHPLTKNPYFEETIKVLRERDVPESVDLSMLDLGEGAPRAYYNREKQRPLNTSEQSRALNLANKDKWYLLAEVIRSSTACVKKFFPMDDDLFKVIRLIELGYNVIVTPHTLGSFHEMIDKILMSFLYTKEIGLTMCSSTINDSKGYIDRFRRNINNSVPLFMLDEFNDRLTYNTTSINSSKRVISKYHKNNSCGRNLHVVKGVNKASSVRALTTYINRVTSSGGQYLAIFTPDIDTRESDIERVRKFIDKYSTPFDYSHLMSDGQCSGNTNMAILIDIDKDGRINYKYLRQLSSLYLPEDNAILKRF